MIRDLIAFSSVLLANASQGQLTAPKTNVIFNIFRTLSLSNPKVDDCGDFDVLGSQYFPGDDYNCMKGGILYNCQVYDEGFSCS